MQITEMDKLLRDRERLRRLRRTLVEIRDDLGIGRRSVDQWIKLRVTKWIYDVDDILEKTQQEIKKESARNRKAEREAAKHDKTGMGAGRREIEPETDHPAAADGRGRHEANGIEEHKRTGTEARVRGELVSMGTMRGVAAGNASGGREYAKAGGTAEACLRMRYEERNEIRDWQREIMERDRVGKHEERITI